MCLYQLSKYFFTKAICCVPFNLIPLLCLYFMFFFSCNVAYSTPYLGTQKSYVYCDSTTKHLVVKYHSNGKLKEKGYQGYYSNALISTGAFLGTWKTYDVNGRLILSTYYHNDVPSKAFIEKKRYYTNGKLKSIERFNNYELYESEVDAIGTWQYFNRNGKLIKKINHKPKATNHDH